MVAQVSPVLPLLEVVAHCASHRVRSTKLVTSCHPRHDLPDRVLQLARDDPPQARAEQPVEEMTPQVGPVREVMPDARCLEVMTHHGRRERFWEEVAASSQEIPMENWLIETTIGVVGDPLPQ